MLKRKILAGGYHDSSDEESLDNGLKRTKPALYAPPRLTAASRSGFRLPGSSGAWPRVSTPPSRQVSVSSSSSQPTLVPESVRSTPEVQTAGLVPKSRGSTVEPSSTAIPTVPKGTAKPSFELPDTYKPNNSRSSLALERQINDLTETFEEYKRTSEARQKTADDALKSILEAVGRLEPTGATASQASNASLSIPSNSSGVKPHLSNPTPTPELIAIVSKVVSEARSRVGKKKGGMDDNSCKEHARVTFYRMLGITAAREVQPYFEDEYGDPDTLPSQFVDPDTGYCQPYPHWRVPLTKQVAWVPTYILRFKTTIPNDQSELSKVLRSLSDEAIVILLHDGAFKSATTAWRDAKKTDAEIEAMRSNARRYQRSDRKAAARAAYIKTIPSLQAPEWDYLSHPGYVSQDESDTEGRLITKRPEGRAQWEVNLNNAIMVAERAKARGKPHIPHRSVEIVRRPIPHLERGTGNGKVTVRIAVCGISNTWRQQHQDELKKHTHLLNMKVTAKPDINSFLEQHPISNTYSGDDDNEGDKCNTVKLEGGQLGEKCTNPTSSEGGDEANHVAAWESFVYDGEEESGAILEMIGNLPGHETGVGDQPGVSEPVEGVGIGDKDNFPIDPQLTVEDAYGKGGRPGGEDWPGGLPALPEGVVLASSYNSGMPPPPPHPDQTQNTFTSEVAGSSVSSSSAVIPKRRGRPPGSKNKPKVKV